MANPTKCGRRSSREEASSACIPRLGRKRLGSETLSSPEPMVDILEGIATLQLSIQLISRLREPCPLSSVYRYASQGSVEHG